MAAAGLLPPVTRIRNRAGCDSVVWDSRRSAPMVAMAADAVMPHVQGLRGRYRQIGDAASRGGPRSLMRTTTDRNRELERRQAQFLGGGLTPSEAPVTGRHRPAMPALTTSGGNPRMLPTGRLRFRFILLVCSLLPLTMLLIGTAPVHAEVDEIRVPLGAGGFGFLPLYVMKARGLIEQHAREAGLDKLQVRWIQV